MPCSGPWPNPDLESVRLNAEDIEAVARSRVIRTPRARWRRRRTAFDAGRGQRGGTRSRLVIFGYGAKHRLDDPATPARGNLASRPGSETGGYANGGIPVANSRLRWLGRRPAGGRRIDDRAARPRSEFGGFGSTDGRGQQPQQYFGHFTAAVHRLASGACSASRSCASPCRARTPPSPPWPVEPGP
jgi:hypothetical protein